MLTLEFSSSIAGKLAGKTITSPMIALSKALRSIVGNFSISGTLPTIDLKALLKAIIGDVIVFPASFPAIELENSRVSIQKFQQDYVCQISTTVDQWGSIMVDAAKQRGQWGVAAGFALPGGWKLSTLTTLPIFDDLAFDSLALVVSSFRDPGFVF